MNREKSNRSIFYIPILICTISFLIIFIISFLHATEILAYTKIGALIFLHIFGFLSYRFIDKISKKKKIGTNLLIACITSTTIFVLVDIVPFFHGLEESSVSYQFATLRKSVSKMESADHTVFMPPSKARRDIRIIGITTGTLEQVEGGKWPLDWKYYASLIDVFKNTNNILMFDIFFADYKKDNNQLTVLQDSIKDSNNILLDYPLEISIESKSHIQNADKRMEVLRKYKLINVQDPMNKGISWAKFTNPPIESIAQYSAGIGFANIKKDEARMNRKLPMVAKFYSHGPNREIEYYPSIDFVIACKYYGIDIIKDTEVKMGEYVKLKNIPKREIKTKNPGEKSIKKDIMSIPNPQREILIPIDLEGQMEINFPGGRYNYHVDELFDVSTTWDKNTIKDNEIENTIYLVAMYYATGRGSADDTHISPYGDLSGVEFHAHALNTIFNQDFLVQIPQWTKLLCLCCGTSSNTLFEKTSSSMEE